MSEPGRQGPGIIMFREVSVGCQECVGEPSVPGLAARAARRQALLDVTHGAAGRGEVHAAVLWSE